jgi:hypothetical protein
MDNEKPTVSWFSPVFEGGVYQVGNEVVSLIANASDNLDISMVRFKRWDPDPLNLKYIIIGFAYNYPYRYELDTRPLLAGWNEIDIEAYDTAGNVSAQRRILIKKTDKNRLYLSLNLHR